MKTTCINCKIGFQTKIYANYCQKCINATDEERHEIKMEKICKMLGVPRETYKTVK